MRKPSSLRVALTLPRGALRSTFLSPKPRILELKDIPESELVLPYDVQPVIPKEQRAIATLDHIINNYELPPNLRLEKPDRSYTRDSSTFRSLKSLTTEEKRRINIVGSKDLIIIV